MYYGFWNNNKRDKNGMYIWIDEPLGNEQFEPANFDTYVGLIENDTFKRGTYLSKNGDDYYLYHGNFDNELKKLMIMLFIILLNMIDFSMEELKKMFLMGDTSLSLTLNQVLCKI